MFSVWTTRFWTPIGVVFTPDIMTQFMLSSLWRAKRMEWIHLSWKTGQPSTRDGKTTAGATCFASTSVASEMIHFIHQMAYYTTEVMECGWDSLQQMINTAEKPGRDNSAHEEFLGTLCPKLHWMTDPGCPHTAESNLRPNPKVPDTANRIHMTMR